jgi:hypothetical protein
MLSSEQYRLRSTEVNTLWKLQGVCFLTHRLHFLLWLWIVKYQ